MKTVVQRVSKASVSVDGRNVGEIGSGLLVLAGFGTQDVTADLEWMLRKILGLRIFPDGEGVMNLSVRETGGSLLIVSQFTLHADARKGRRPSYIRAAQPERAAMLYALFVEMASHCGLPVAAGIFGAIMDVSLVNFGPVTILLDSPSESVF
jgi:D-tyrosyl-tRNA(Tyr) deacylase